MKLALGWKGDIPMSHLAIVRKKPETEEMGNQSENDEELMFHARRFAAEMAEERRQYAAKKGNTLWIYWR